MKMQQLQKNRIGFIGLGAMGKPMAANIAKASFPLTVYDVREEPLAEMRKLGAKVVNGAKELGKKSDTVVVVVRTYPQVKQVVFPPEGVLGGMQSGSTLIIASTISPLEIIEVEKIAKKSSVTVIDAPVSGGTVRAQNKTLTIIVGGEDKVIRENNDVLKAMGEYIYHVGKVGQGQAVKMINQLLVAANIASTVEALVMAKKLDINIRVLLEIISNSTGDSWMWRQRVPRILYDDTKIEGLTWPVPGKLNIMAKDTRAIMETGTKLGVPLPISSVANQLFQDGEARGLGELDDVAVIKLHEEITGLRVSEQGDNQDK
jgi:3-hydroxyisobutyrate dehydrogenase-like beta-hydroxyacid dehydrogenase